MMKYMMEWDEDGEMKSEEVEAEDMDAAVMAMMDKMKGMGKDMSEADIRAKMKEMPMGGDMMDEGMDKAA